MQEQKSAQVFRAKYEIAYGTKPTVKIGTVEKKTEIRVESPVNGEIIIFHGYQANDAKTFCDKLGIYYNESEFEMETTEQKIDPNYLKALKALQTEMTVWDTDNRMNGGGEWSREIILETPTSEGSGAHIKRRKTLERFLQGWGMEFSVECFTVHSDTVCRLA